MKVIKPQRLGVLHRTFEHHHQNFFAVTALAFVPLDATREMLPEIAMWKFAPTEVPNGVVDEGMPKTRGEVLAFGKAYPIGRKASGAVAVRVRVGKIDKSLHAVGLRHWETVSVSPPTPFLEMPLDWAHAYGGPAYPKNPHGKGFLAKGADRHGQPLPNVEHPNEPVRSPMDRPQPAGFGPYEMSWPQRITKAGTYDKTWLKTLYPGYPADVDWTLFNCAPADQQMEGFFVGDEEFEIENMHPDLPRQRGRLPGLRTRAFVNIRVADGALALREVDMRLETVQLFPHAQRAILVYRGVTRVAEDDAADVAHLLIAGEWTTEQRPRGHYEQLLSDRLDAKKPGLALLQESDLLPTDLPALRDAPVKAPDNGILARNLTRLAVVERAKVREKLAAAGLDPSQFAGVEDVPASADAKTPKAMLERIAEMRETVKGALDSRGERMTALREKCASVGVDLDAKIAEAKKAAGGPPKFNARDHVEQLRKVRAEVAANGGSTAAIDARLNDPAFEAGLILAETKLRETYVRFAHKFPGAAKLEGEHSTRVREALLAEYASGGRDFSSRDLMGADLSHTDFRSADFHGALFDGADFRGARLDGANFSGSVLARVNLTDANLAGADLRGANLGAAVLERAQLNGANLERASLGDSNLATANLSGANLTGADVDSARFDGTDLSGASADELTFLKCSLRGVRFAGAKLRKALFLETDLRDADFADADLGGATVLKSDAAGASFQRAKAAGIRFVGGASAKGANFEEANLAGANLRGVDLSGGRFARANLDDADLSEANLKEAQMYRVVARRARFVRSDLTDAVLTAANLMNADVQKAVIQGASFQGANLFGADFGKVRGGARDMTGALLTNVRVTPRSGNGKG